MCFVGKPTGYFCPNPAAGCCISMIPNRLDRDTDLGHKLLRIVGNAIVNERDLTGKAGNLHFVLVNIVQHFGHARGIPAPCRTAGVSM